MNNFETKIIRELDEMLPFLPLLQQMYPDLDSEQYRARLEDMVPYRYAQMAIFDQDVCIGLSGFWIHTKLWTGRILEMDNVIVHENYRGKGIGTILYHALEKIALDNECQTMVLDAFVGNFKAHKLYYQLGFVAKGYHFVKFL